MAEFQCACQLDMDTTSCLAQSPPSFKEGERTQNTLPTLDWVSLSQNDGCEVFMELLYQILRIA